MREYSNGRNEKFKKKVTDNVLLSRLRVRVAPKSMKYGTVRHEPATTPTTHLRARLTHSLDVTFFFLLKL